MFDKINNLKDVVDWRLCVGCGVCKFASTSGRVNLVNNNANGIRPEFDTEAEKSSAGLLGVCPGYSVNADKIATQDSDKTNKDPDLGPVVEIWEGHATDDELRHRGSSGGVLTALALWCIEKGGMTFALHSGMDLERPWLTKTVTSRSRSELLQRSGSRYAPASPCDSLELVESAVSPCVFIGKPCDVTAVASVRETRPALDAKLGLVLGFFCAGTPSTDGTLNLLDQLHVEKDSVEELHYRGNGWPGGFNVTSAGQAGDQFIPYPKAWEKLTPFVPIRCRLCPDGLGRFADISCGDAWEQFDDSRPNPGLSIIIVRSKKGRGILERAASDGYVTLIPAKKENVMAAQIHLLGKRRELFGRLVALRALLIPIPEFRGFSLCSSWLGLSPIKMFRTIGGTLRRAIERGWTTRNTGAVAEHE